MNSKNISMPTFEEKNRRIFVYGSLLHGAPTEILKLLKKQSKLIGEGSVTGRLYDLGDYPVAKTTDSDDLIWGKVYEIKNGKWNELIEQLDKYEGDEFIRWQSYVFTEGENCSIAWVYWYKPPVTGRKRIVSGDWLKHYWEKESEKLYNGIEWT